MKAPAAIDKGRWAEKYVEGYLAHNGLRRIAANYRCRWGEIDLICTEQRTLVFVEIRFRSTIGVMRPEETISFAKQQRIIKTAGHYLQHHPFAAHLDCRFDVVALTGEESRPAVSWFKGAFEA